MLIQLLRAGSPAERAELAQFLAQPRRERRLGDVTRIRERMDAYGCLERARETAHALAGAALHEYAAAYADVPDSRDKRFVEALVTWVLERA